MFSKSTGFNSSSQFMFKDFEAMTSRSHLDKVGLMVFNFLLYFKIFKIAPFASLAENGSAVQKFDS